MEEEKTIAHLPGDVLGHIFRYAALTDVAAEDMCNVCERPIYWMLRMGVGGAIRATCSWWRHVYLHKVIVASLNSARDELDWCNSPLACHNSRRIYLLMMSARRVNPFIRVGRRRLEEH